MKAFHNDPEFKAQLVAAARKHRKAGDYISSTYTKENGRFRSCSLGCSLRDVQTLRGIEAEDYGDHALLADTLGVPEWLCLLQDAIFEGLPDDQRAGWTERLYSAIPVGADLEPVRHKLAILRLTRLAGAQRKALKSATDEHGLHQAIKQVLAALDQVIACHRSELGEIDCEADWSAAESAAESAAQSAAESAESAESSARSARSVARSARSAQSAAESAESAESAKSTWSAAWQQEADDLIELLKGVET